jgi:hypothetical protein
MNKKLLGRKLRGERAKKQTDKLLRAALQRLLDGSPTHSKHIGRTVRITPTSVCREARLSRQSVYTSHREFLKVIMSHRKTVTARNSTAEQQRAGLRLRLNEAEAQLKKALSENLNLVVRLNESKMEKLREIPAPSRWRRVTR